jgi:hypothetical protein
VPLGERAECVSGGGKKKDPASRELATPGSCWWADLFRVREARYQLRQPPEVETGFEPVYTDLQSVASPLGHSTGEEPVSTEVRETLSERTTGFEPATLTLAR